MKFGQNLEPDLDLQIKKPLPARNIRLTSSTDVAETFTGEGRLPTGGVSVVQRGNDLPGEGEVQIDSGLTNLSMGRFEYNHPQEDGIGRKGRTRGMGDNVYSTGGMQTKMFSQPGLRACELRRVDRPGTRRRTTRAAEQGPEPRR